MFDLSTSTKLNVILGLFSALIIFLIVLLCRKCGEGYKVPSQATKEEEVAKLVKQLAASKEEENARRLAAARQLTGAPKDEAKQLISSREEALARRLAAAKEKELVKQLAAARN